MNCFNAQIAGKLPTTYATIVGSASNAVIVAVIPILISLTMATEIVSFESHGDCSTVIEDGHKKRNGFT